MFNFLKKKPKLCMDYRVTQLESEKDSLQKQVEDLMKRVNILEEEQNQFEYIQVSEFAPFVAYNKIPAQKVIDRILDHLKLRIFDVPDKSKGIVLKKAKPAKKGGRK